MREWRGGGGCDWECKWSVGIETIDLYSIDCMQDIKFLVIFYETNPN